MARECTVTREEFHRDAKAFSFDVDGTKVVMEPGDFASGSFGWKFQGKVQVDIGGKSVWVQVGFNATVIGSKRI